MGCDRRPAIVPVFQNHHRAGVLAIARRPALAPPSKPPNRCQVQNPNMVNHTNNKISSSTTQQHIYASCHLIIHPIELHSGSLKKCSFNACWRNTVGRKRRRNGSTKSVVRTMTNATTTFLLAAHRHHSWT